MQDDDTDLRSTQRTVRAGSMPPPKTTGASSVFDAGRKAKAANKRAPIDLSGIVIRKGVQKPLALFERKSVYVDLINRMVPGDMVELPIKQARSLFARCKEHTKTATPPAKFSFRTLNESTGGVWRDA